VVCKLLNEIEAPGHRASVLVDLGTNRIFELNETGTRIWELLCEGLDAEGIVHQLIEEFDVDEPRAVDEVRGLIRQLRDRGPTGSMSSQLGLAVADGLPAKGPPADWVLPLSLQDPGRLLPSPLQWAERGALLSFFDGLLFDREELAASINRGKPDCSDAELILHA
jgi:hypothetical protein